MCLNDVYILQINFANNCCLDYIPWQHSECNIYGLH